MDKNLDDTIRNDLIRRNQQLETELKHTRHWAKAALDLITAYMGENARQLAIIHLREAIADIPPIEAQAPQSDERNAPRFEVGDRVKCADGTTGVISYGDDSLGKWFWRIKWDSDGRYGNYSSDELEPYEAEQED